MPKYTFSVNSRFSNRKTGTTPLSGWQNTQIQITARQSMSYRASGVCTWYSNRNRTTGPDGRSDPDIVRSQFFLAPNLPLLSLIGKIGNGQPFFIGTNRKLTAGTAGTLYLGFNDSYCADNNGVFQVSIATDSPTVNLSGRWGIWAEGWVAGAWTLTASSDGTYKADGGYTYLGVAKLTGSKLRIDFTSKDPAALAGYSEYDLDLNLTFPVGPGKMVVTKGTRKGTFKSYLSKTG